MLNSESRSNLDGPPPFLAADPSSAGSITAIQNRNACYGRYLHCSAKPEDGIPRGLYFSPSFGSPDNSWTEVM